jgi:HPt (histidine-containing phosphotransfer) domain-containing protein
MAERDELQQKIADIGGRYIQRTAGEISGLPDMIAKVRAGDAAACKEIEHLAHKIYGSGAMFGFDAVSDQARALELAVRDVTDPGRLDKLQEHADRLQQTVHAALRARRLQ